MGWQDGELEDRDVVKVVDGLGVVERDVEEEGIGCGLVFEGCVESDGGVGN
jgi:hypothetical protein